MYVKLFRARFHKTVFPVDVVLSRVSIDPDTYIYHERGA